VVLLSGWLGLDWGDVPAWFGAVVTSGSFAVAAIAYGRSVRDQERIQAAAVAAWTTPRLGPDGEECRFVVISNAM
jgi:hypothetical protein